MCVSGETSTAFGNPNSTRKRKATIFNCGYFNMFAPKCSPISSPMNNSRQTCFGSLLYYNNNQQNQVICMCMACRIWYDMTLLSMQYFSCNVQPHKTAYPASYSNGQRSHVTQHRSHVTSQVTHQEQEFWRFSLVYEHLWRYSSLAWSPFPPLIKK